MTTLAKPLANHDISSNAVWRNDITGLRALAVIPVVLYHAFPNVIPGGYYGVDIFFVISGYLISGIIFKGLLNQSFSYKDFYVKRIKRILPNLSLLFAFVLLVGLFYLTSSEYRALGKHVYSSGLFIQNFRLLKDVGYFTIDALHQPLLHLWSLAIEEQFYIVFPIICAVLFKKWRSVKLLSIVTMTIVIGSLVFCFTSGQGRDFNFYFPLTRFWEIGFGITLALAEKFYAFKSTQIPQIGRHALSVIGLGMIAIAMMTADATTVHPGAFTLLPVLGAVALIASYPDALVNRYLLCLRPMTFVGLISYSLYLWHWPFLAFLFICYPEASNALKALILVLSVVVSTLIYVGVENPVRRSIRIGHVKTEIVCLGLLVAGVLAGVLVSKFDGFPNRSFGFASHTQMFKHEGDWSFYHEAPSISYGAWKIRTPTPDRFPTIIFAGDSHAEQYYLRAKSLSEKANVSTGFVTNGGCLILSPVEKGFQEEQCRKASDSFFELLKDARVKTVVMSHMWGPYPQESLTDGLQKLETAVRARGDLKVFILLDNPWSDGNAPTTQSFNPLQHVNRLSPEAAQFVISLPSNPNWSQMNEWLRTRTKGWTTVIETSPYICPNGLCNVAEWYRDENHLQPNALEEKAVWLDPIFQK